MRTIACIVHVYSEQRPDYAKMFTAQLSSVALHPPQTCRIEFEVWTTATDQLTHRVCAAFQQHFRQRQTPASITIHTLPKGQLFRRSIGRNISAKECTADVCWFADADYVLGRGALDAMAAVDFEKIKPHEMVFPGFYLQAPDHRAGDQDVQRISAGSIVELRLHDYQRRRLRMGIGGLQIVSREIALRGYCDGTDWVKPVPRAKDFQDTAEDRVYRGSICSSIPIDVPNLYRLRHTASAFEPEQDRSRRMKHKRGFA